MKGYTINSVFGRKQKVKQEMTITFPPDIALRIQRYAAYKGVTPNDAVVEITRTAIPEEMLSSEANSLGEPIDEWEADILNMGKFSTAVLSDEALSREQMYD